MTFKKGNTRAVVLWTLCAVVLLSAAYCTGLFFSACHPTRLSTVPSEDSGAVTVLLYNGTDMPTDGQFPEFSILDVQAGENLSLRYHGNGGTFFSIVGYCYYPGESVEVFDSSFVLRDNASGEYYQIPTTQVTNLDIPADDTGAAYGGSGMRGLCWQRFLPKNTTFHLYMRYGNDGRDVLIDTGVDVSE